MPYVTAYRNIRVDTLIGHTIPVEAKKVQFVPPEVLPIAIEKGCFQCDENGKLKLDVEDITSKVPVIEVPTLSEADRENPEKRASAIFQAVAKLYNDNDAKNFNAGNKLPRVKAIESLLGFPTSAAEVSAAVEKFHTNN